MDMRIEPNLTWSKEIFLDENGTLRIFMSQLTSQELSLSQARKSFHWAETISQKENFSKKL